MEYIAGRMVMRVPTVVLDASEYPAVLDPTVGAELDVDSPIDSVASLDQWAPAIGHAGVINAEFLVVWRDTRRSGVGYNSDVFGAHVTRNGTVLEPEGFIISNSGEGGEHANPVVEWDGSTAQYVVVYRRTLSGGQSILAIAIATGARNQDSPAIACNGTNFYVVWVDERNGNRDVYGSMINAATGQVLNPGGVAIATTIGREDHPAIAYGGGDFKVALDGANVFIQFATVSGVTGALLSGPTTITGRESNTYPDIAFDGTTFWIVWQRNIAGNLDLAGASLTPSGTVGAITTLENQGAAQRYPKVAWDPAKGLYTVAFEDDRNIASNGTDIYARSFTSTGTLVSAAFAVAARAGSELNPHIVARDLGRHEVVYSRNEDVFGQTINYGGLSGLEYAVSTAATLRETTPTIDCSSSTNCMVPYRWLDEQSINNPIDRIKARLVSYP